MLTSLLPSSRPLLLLSLLAGLIPLAAAEETTPAATAPVETTPASAPAAVSTQPILATAAGETSGQRVELLSLKRNNGDTLTLTFTLINDSEQPLKFGYDFVEKGKNVPDFASIGGTHLVDASAKKKYLVLRDSTDLPLSSTGIADVAAKSRVTLWAKFPAPPASTQTISVVIPHFVPLDDVTISP